MSSTRHQEKQIVIAAAPTSESKYRAPASSGAKSQDKNKDVAAYQVFESQDDQNLIKRAAADNRRYTAGFQTPQNSQRENQKFNTNIKIKDAKIVDVQKIDDFSSKREGLFSDLRSQRDWDKCRPSKSARRYNLDDNDENSDDDAKSWGTTKLKIQEANEQVNNDKVSINTQR